MVKTTIAGNSPDRYRNVTGLPRCGGPASPWRACLAVNELAIKKEPSLASLRIITAYNYRSLTFTNK